jgi:tetratricopeptide (TPR) repeat protein
MKKTIQCGFALVLIALLCAQLSQAQSSGRDRLHEADKLSDRGEYEKALAILEPLASSPPDVPDPGTIWLLLGSVYKDLGRYPEAQRAYQSAISLYKKKRGREREEAAALDHLGSLYFQIGQLEMSKRLRLRVLQMYQETGDHALLVVVYNNLVATALQRRRFDEAREWIGHAFAEAKLAPQVSTDTRAAVDNNAGSISLHDHKYQQALDYYQAALQAWVEQHGMNHQLTGWGYVSCGRTRTLLGDTQEGLAEVKTGLGMIERAVGRNVPVYFDARMAYADVLSAAGAVSEAKAVRSSTIRSIESLHRTSSKYAISADAFR